MTTQADISAWFDRGVKQKATHMIVVVDTFDYEDYPVYVTAEQNIQLVLSEYNQGKHSMQRVMEVYKLSMDKQKQLNEHRSYNL